MVTLGYQRKNRAEDRTGIHQREGHSKENRDDHYHHLRGVEGHGFESADHAQEHPTQPGTEESRLIRGCGCNRLWTSTSDCGPVRFRFFLRNLRGDLRLEFLLGLHRLLFNLDQRFLKTLPDRKSVV